MARSKRQSTTGETAAAHAQWSRLMRDPVLLTACPEARKPKILLEHGVAVMIQLSNSTDQALAYKAAVWLIGYAQILEREQALLPKATAPAEVIERLRGLYAKALPAAEPLVVESQPAE